MEQYWHTAEPLLQLSTLHLNSKGSVAFAPSVRAINNTLGAYEIFKSMSDVIRLDRLYLWDTILVVFNISL
jgi:hypothetical protein